MEGARPSWSFYKRNRDKLAWCSGVFDGEGWVGCVKISKGCYIRAVVAQKDKRLLVRFQNWTGVGSITGPNNHNMHYLQIQNADNVLWLYELLAPFLGPVKLEQFSNAIQKWMKLRIKKGRVRPRRST